MISLAISDSSFFWLRCCFFSYAWVSLGPRGCKTDAVFFLEGRLLLRDWGLLGVCLPERLMCFPLG